MDKRIEILNSFYDGQHEEARLNASPQGRLEYLTTMQYIRRYPPAPGRALDIGAGTGRYSAALAGEGWEVSALELTERNFALLQEKSAALPKLAACRGDALELSRFGDGTFDLTLLMGPMYHLYNEVDQRQALREAFRVTKPGGVVLTAFLSVHAILYDNYLRGNLFAGLEENFTEDYQIRHFPEQLFTGFNVEEFEAFFDELPVEAGSMRTVAANGILELASGRGDFALSEEELPAYARYHLHFCEKRELLGSSSHLFVICRKV
jgi:SAM-dependent methyltransferase